MRFVTPALLAISIFACGGYESEMPTPEGNAAPAPQAVQAPQPAPQPAASMPVMPAASQPAAATTDGAPGEIEVAGVVLPVSDAWVQEVPSSTMRLAEFTLPSADGDATLAVFCFGTGQGGDIPSNITRWVGQFENEMTPGQPVEPEVTPQEVNGLTVTTVRCRGTYNPGGMGPFAPAPDPIDNAALYGIIIEGGPEGTVFIKTTGPRTAIEDHEEFLNSAISQIHLAQ